MVYKFVCKVTIFNFFIITFMLYILRIFDKITFLLFVNRGVCHVKDIFNYIQSLFRVV